MKIKFDWDYVLKETPQLMVVDIDKAYVTKYLYEPVKKAIDDSKYVATDDPHIFQIPKLFEATYFYYKDNTVIGAVDFDCHTSNGKRFFTPSLTKKFEKDYSDVLVKMYSVASKQFNAYIISGYRQSLSSSSVWKKFFDNPDKYNIKEIYTIPEGLTKEDDIWSEDPIYREVRVVIKF